MSITAGKNAPEDVNMMIEIPMGTNVKYEFDKEYNVMVVDRFSRTSMNYPCNYGFIPGTLSGDGDPVDVLLLSEQSILPGMFIHVRPIGMLEMEDESGIDAKVLAVPGVKGDLTFGKINDISEIDETIKARIKHFFEHYKDLDEGKWVKVKDWLGKEAAYTEIKNGIANAAK
ncbi:MAG: inorganic diphosphatase [Candidatus Levybacteria bacterium]|nr:inorganic diphosphatase [Candidatus Levybacteria bacterium]